MRYDSVLLYADEVQPGFSRFCLPMLCPGNPDNKMVRVRVLIGRNGGTMVDNDFTNKELMGTRALTSLTAAMTPSTTPTMPMMALTAKGHLQRRRSRRRRGGNEQPNATKHAC
jgi:hypothetical protein